MRENIYVIAQNEATGAELLAAADSYGKHTVLISSNTALKGADEILLFEGALADILEALQEKLSEEQPDLVLCEASADGRLAAGFAAVALKTSPLVEPSELALTDEGVTASRMVFGGLAMQNEQSPYPAVVVAGQGVFEAHEATRGNAVVSFTAAAPAGLKLVDRQAREASSVSLPAAKRVVGVGRGLGTANNLPYIDELAQLLEAEIGCTRPVAEEEGWYTKDRYIGVSGCMLKPDFYLAIGISGQVQHMVGVNQAQTIFAIDTNENSVIFQRADYGLIGDASVVLPALIEQLK